MFLFLFGPIIWDSTNANNLIMMMLVLMTTCFFLYFSLLTPFWVTLSFSLLLYTMFFSKSPLMLLILFELSLIPVLFMILSRGYQVERLQATFYFMLYTVCSVLPIFFLLAKAMNLFSFISPSMFSGLMGAFLLAPFLVKLPLFPFHMWLPKAHVEAPTGGSVILAALLLKMGGFALILMWPKIFMGSKLGLYFFALIGSVLTSVSAAAQSDLKALIALSSVAHMNFGISMFLLFISKSWWIILFISLTHALVASALFFFAGDMFYSSLSRLIFIAKISPGLLIGVTLFFLANSGVPPMLAAIPEMLSGMILCAKNLLYFIMFAILSLVVCYFNFFLLGVMMRNSKYISIDNSSVTMIMLFIMVMNWGTVMIL